jgi:hypothetical protein
LLLAISSPCKTTDIFAKCIFTTDRIFDGSAEALHRPKRRDPSDYGRLNPDFQQPDWIIGTKQIKEGEKGVRPSPFFFPRFIPAL